MNMRNRGIYLSVLCCVTYAFAYLCRIDLSAALTKMAAGFSTTTAAVGLFGTVQTFIYACGQLINGYIISRHKPGRVILYAVIGSGLANILMGLTDSFGAALLIWSCNAYVQSLFWSSIVRLISTYPESRSDTTVMWTILVLPLSYIFSWSVLGQVLENVPSWHPYFLIPGILLLTLTPFWMTLKKSCPETDELQSSAVIRTPREIFRYIIEKRVTVYCAVSVLSGILREGILFWAPVLLAQILSGSTISPYLTVSLIPLGRVPSTIALRFLLPKFRDYPRLSSVLFASVTFLCVFILLIPGDHRIPLIILIVLLTFLSAMLGSLFSVYVPLSYSADNMSAPAAGLLDALIYLGGSISTFVLGHILTSDSLNGAAVFWIVTSLLGILLPAVISGPKQPQK